MRSFDLAMTYGRELGAVLLYGIVIVVILAALRLVWVVLAAVNAYIAETRGVVLFGREPEPKPEAPRQTTADVVRIPSWRRNRRGAA